MATLRPMVYPPMTNIDSTPGWCGYYISIILGSYSYEFHQSENKSILIVSVIPRRQARRAKVGVGITSEGLKAGCRLRRKAGVVGGLKVGEALKGC